MYQSSPPSLLVIGAAGLRHPTSDLDIYTANSIREAVATIRLLTFDLLVVGLENPRIDVWEMMRRVQATWPQQRWMLLSARVTAEEEVLARSLGALLIMHQLPDDCWLTEFAHSLRRRETRESQLIPTACLETNLLTGDARRTA